MFLPEFLRVTRFAVCYISLSGLGIIYDVSTQNSNLCHALFSRFDLRREFIVMCRGSRSLFFQNRILQQVILRQVIHGLRHLLQIENFSPSRIASTFSSLQFCLNVHQQIDLGRLRLHGGIFTGRMPFFTGQHRTDFCFTVPGPQLVIHAGYILPAGSFEPDCFPAPRYFAAHFCKQFQQRIKVRRFLLQRSVNHHP